MTFLLFYAYLWAFLPENVFCSIRKRRNKNIIRGIASENGMVVAQWQSTERGKLCSSVGQWDRVKSEARVILAFN